MLKARIIPYTLQFAFTAHTSRETFTEKPTLYLEVFDDNIPEVCGVGEIAFFPSLQDSYKTKELFKAQVADFVANIDVYASGRPLPENSAIRFGYEMAMANLAQKGRKGVYQSDEILNRLAGGIRINGLVWMNDHETMRRHIQQKIEEGFHCIKLKIGALDFDREVELISEIRHAFPTSSELEIRVDANGAFTPGNVMQRLDKLARYDLHSIEQPLPRDCSEMVRVCHDSPIPIALDEDMVERWFDAKQCADWLSSINPSYIVLKPSLVGGFEATDRWIKTAEALGVGWWVTSALESNVGLSAIAQFLGNYPEQIDRIAHGLGTGRIYTNNPSSNIHIEGERLYIDL